MPCPAGRDGFAVGYLRFAPVPSRPERPRHEAVRKWHLPAFQDGWIKLSGEGAGRIWIAPTERTARSDRPCLPWIS
jgi:hypothetical protein